MNARKTVKQRFGSGATCELRDSWLPNRGQFALRLSASSASARPAQDVKPFETRQVNERHAPVRAIPSWIAASSTGRLMLRSALNLTQYPVTLALPSLLP